MRDLVPLQRSTFKLGLPRSQLNPQAGNQEKTPLFMRKLPRPGDLLDHIHQLQSLAPLFDMLIYQVDRYTLE